MLRSIQLENFKAFGQRTVIPLAPITLIFGQNSAGKSSILHALSLLKQSRDSREPSSLLLPRSDKGFVDLGSFREMVFNHDPERHLALRLDISSAPPHPPDSSFAILGDSIGVGIEWSFYRRLSDITLDHLHLFSLMADKPLATFDPKRAPKPKANRRRSIPYVRSSRNDRVLLGKCTFVTQSPEEWSGAYSFYKEHANEFLTILKAERERLRDRRSHTFHDTRFIGQSEFEKAADDIQETIAFFEDQVDLPTFIHRMSERQLGSLFTFDGIIPSMDQRSWGETGYVDELLQSSEDFYYSPNQWTLDMPRIAVEAGRLVDNTLNAIYPMSPFRKPPSRWYIYSGSEVRNVGFDGELLPDLLFRTPSLVDETNRWLAKLETGYKLKIRGFGAKARDLYEIRLVDSLRSKKVEVGLLDVGFGISQMLPFIVQSLAANDQIITIEQPEIHIHPRLQADLGDLLAEAIAPPRSNQFIIETHSEHLILRLQRLVRSKTLKPSDISVVAVRRGPEGSVAVPLQLDDEGDFTDDFPGGFFPERLRELR